MQGGATEFRPVLALAVEEALRFLDHLELTPVGATCGAAALRERLARPLADAGCDPETVINDLVRDVDGGLLGTPGGRFFAWVIGGALPAALAADWLTSAWDQNAVLYSCSPAAAIVEEVVGAWLKELLRIPPSASFALVTGCQMAHVTCLAAARHALLCAHGWDIARQGIFGAPRIRILSSNRRHASIDRALRLLGFGTDDVEYLGTTGDESLDPTAACDALRRNADKPTILLLAAGDINTGAFDNFEEIIPAAKAAGAWVHVDGAFGLWAAASPRYCHLTRGLSTADSWATDGHKWLNVPFDCGYAFVADPSAHQASMSTRAPYITESAEARDEIDWNPEWSRRARGFSTYAALRELGRDGIAALIERTCTHARGIIDGIERLPGAQILWKPVINQGLVRFLAPGGTDRDHDARTMEIIERIVASGEAFFGPTTWRDKRAMRVSVLNWRTSSDDVARAVAAVKNALAACDD
jgi:glutamate/tyrosine decarboxylase-like PLP-dependent enzyme